MTGLSIPSGSCNSVSQMGAGPRTRIGRRRGSACGRADEGCVKGFEEQIELYPSSGEVPAALYWRGRLAEEDGEPAKARAYYQKVSERFRNYYYGELARQQLRKLKSDGDTGAICTAGPHSSNRCEDTKVTADPVPTDNLRVQKAQLLANGALLDFAVKRTARGGGRK